MSSPFGLEKKNNTDCKDFSKSHRTAEQTCGHRSMNKHLVEMLTIAHTFFVFVFLTFHTPGFTSMWYEFY